MSESTLRIGVLYPEVLGTYGDTGNAVVLCERARRRGIMLTSSASIWTHACLKTLTCTPWVGERTPPRLSPLEK